MTTPEYYQVTYDDGTVIKIYGCATEAAAKSLALRSHPEAPFANLSFVEKKEDDD